MEKPKAQTVRAKCPKCGSEHFRYDGYFIKCLDCGVQYAGLDSYREWKKLALEKEQKNDKD